VFYVFLGNSDVIEQSLVTLHSCFYGKYGRARQATDDNVMACMRFACWITKAIDTHLECVLLNAFHSNSGFTNAPQCYVYMYITCFILYTKQFLHTLYNMTQYNCKSCFMYKMPVPVLNVYNCVNLKTVYTDL
jgi:hypothetical protein